MNKYYETLTNTSGDILSGHRVQVIDSAGSIVTIYADAGQTRFKDADGNNVNYATSDNTNGLAEFYWTAATGQTLQILDESGELSLAIADFANNYSTPDVSTNIDAILGVSASDEDLGEFTGSTISDDQAIKPALQELELATEARPTSATLIGMGGAALIGTADGETVEARLSRLQIPSIAALEALTPNNGDAAYLRLSGRSGGFIFSTADLSSVVSADAAQGVYIAPASDATGASGAWVRQYETLKPEYFGALGDDATDDLTALTAATTWAHLNSVPLHLAKGKTYKHSASIGTFTSGTFELTGAGKLEATTTGFKSLKFASLTKLRISQICIFGGASSGQAGSSNAGLIDILQCDDVRINDITTGASEYVGIAVFDSTDVHVSNCYVNDCLQGIKFRGVRGGSIVNCRSEGKISTLATFQTCIALDSTNGHAYGVCQDIIVRDNNITGWGDSEAFLMHAGQRIQFLNNKSEGCCIGLSVAAFDTGAADDIIEDVLVDGNYFDVETTLTSGDIGGQAGILISGTDDIQAKRVKVCNNTVVNSNQQWQNAAGIAAYRWTYTDDCEAYNNTAINSRRAAFLNTGANTNLVWHGNNIQGVTEAGYAYWALNNPTSTSVAKISGGRVDDAASVVLNTIGSLIWLGDDISYTNISGTVFVAAQVGREITITGGSDVDLSNDVTSVFFASGTAHNITTVLGAVIGRQYLFRFNNGNTTIVRNGTNFKTVAALNLTPGKDHSTIFTARSPVQLTQMAATANAA